MGAVQADAFLGMAGLLLLAGLVDWILGRTLAVRRNDYCGATARLGWLSKGAGILMILFVRGGEGWAARHAGWAGEGWVATGLALGLFLAELDSINQHRVSAGGPVIPGWDAAMTTFRRLAERLSGR